MGYTESKYRKMGGSLTTYQNKKLQCRNTKKKNKNKINHTNDPVLSEWPHKVII
jgi:hypothetical protein